MTKQIQIIIDDIFQDWNVQYSDNLIYLRKKGKGEIVEDMNYLEALYDISEEELSEHLNKYIA